MAMRIFEHMVVGPLQCNCYIVGDDQTKEAIVIDPGEDADRIVVALASHELKVKAIVATHAHFDHILGADLLRQSTGAPFYIHSQDQPLLEWVGPSMVIFLGVQGVQAPETDGTLDDGDQLSAGSVKLEVLHTPGHSPGSICLLAPDQVLFSGDTLFAQGIGRTDLPGGDSDQLLTSIKQRLFALGEVPVLPGHGPATTLDRERSSNPFLGGLWSPGSS
ncbi:MAG TPA: MBL fold metallo-hydrolase [Actinomycetota bacterium]|nr:MBL fold metallo-hydrolase [Actinomycetota bacterium]